MSQRIYKLTIAFSLLFLFGACSSTTTRIKTKPSGAKIYIDGELVGKSPTVYFGKTSGGRRYHVQLEKEGYEDVDLYIDNTLRWWSPLTLLFPYGGGLYLYLAGWSLAGEYQFNLRALSAIEPAATTDAKESLEVEEITEEDVARKMEEAAPKTAMDELDESTKDATSQEPVVDKDVATQEPAAESAEP